MNSKALQFVCVLLFIVGQLPVQAQTTHSVIWTDAIGATGNYTSTLTKTATNSWGNSGAVSMHYLPANTDGWFEYTVTEIQSSKSIGFSEYLRDFNQSSVIYSLHMAGSTLTARNTWNVLQTTTVAVGDVVRMERVGSTIFYKKNGIVFHSISDALTIALIVHTSLYNNGLVLSGVQASFGPSGTHPITWTNLIGLSLSGSNLLKIGNYGTTNSEASSVELLAAGQDGWIEMEADATTSNNSRIIGLAPSSSSVYPIAFGISIGGTNLNVYEGGVNIAYLGTCSNGDAVRVAREGSAIKYYVNGILKYTSSQTTSSELKAIACATYSKAIISGVNSSFGTPIVMPPAKPINVRAVTTQTAIVLNWTDNSTNETGFEIERALSLGGTYSLVNTAIENSSTFSDPLANGTIYFYRVRAVNSAGASAYSSVVAAQAFNPAQEGVFDVEWTDITGATANGPTALIKTAVNGWNNSEAMSLHFLPSNTNGWMEFLVGEVNVVKRIGFSDFNDNSSVDYNFEFTQGGNADAYNDGTLLTLNPVVVGDWLRIERVGSNIIFKKNGSVIHTLTSGLTSPLVVDVTLFDVGSSISNVKTSFGPVINQPVDWSMLKGMSMSGSNLWKTAGYGLTNSRAISTTVLQASENGWIEMRTDGTTADNGRTIGLSAAGSNPDSPIQFAILLNGTNMQVFESGSNVFWMGNSVSGDAVRVAREGTAIKYYVNNVLKYTSTQTSSTALVAAANVTHAATLLSGVNCSFGPAPITVPGEPTNLSSTVSTTSVHLSWVDNVANETGFQIERSLNSGSGFTAIALTTANVTTYIDPVSNGNLYYYRVRAVNSAGYSGYTSETAALAFGAGQGVVPDQTEFLTLKDFYNNLGGTGWLYKTNWPTGNWNAPATIAQMDTWYGIDVENGDVSALMLLQNNLTGTIPASISNLAALKVIDFRINLIGGTIPATITSMTSLLELKLYDNLLTGEIPIDIGNLTNLTYFTVAKNLLTGPVPQSVGNLTSLYWFGIYRNAGLTGQLPSSFYNLTNLTDLYIYNTQISGSLEPEIGNFTQLKNFWGYSNNWSGELPASLGNIAALENLYLHDNEFTGALPVNWQGLTNVKNFWVHFNQLNGELPDWLGNLNKLVTLSVGDNNLTGIIPNSFSNLTDLTQLYLQNLEISGPIPDQLVALNKLTIVDLKFTNLSGPIPVWLMMKPTLKTFTLNNSKFTSLPDISSRIDKASLTLQVEGNQIPVTDLERYFTASNTHPFKAFSYGPQNAVIESTLNVPVATTLSIEAPAGGTQGVYMWEKLENEVWTSINSQNQSTVANNFTLGNATELQAGTYRYSVTNNWLPQINYQSGPITLNITDGLIATANPLYNGNITSTRWRTTKAYASGENDFEGMFVYDYDDKYQLTDASLVNYHNGVFVPAGNMFRETGMTFDPNGNILSLKRYDKNAGLQHDFTYSYQTNTNKLQSVSGYADSYTYNAIGQMTAQDNVTGTDMYVDYDVTGKVTQVFSDAAKTKLTTRYLYDDRGFRLAKETYNTSGDLEFTTWYIRDASGNVMSTYEQSAGQSQITLTEIPVYGSGKLGMARAKLDGSLEYIYELTDHLGNVRATIKSSDDVYLATMEDTGVPEWTNPRVRENMFFKNLDETDVSDDRMNHTPDEVVANAEWSSYLHWINDGNPATRENLVGPAIALQVDVGDSLSLETWAKFERKVSYNRNATTGMLSNLLGNLFVDAAYGLETATEAKQVFNTNLSAALGGTGGDPATRPYAYLNYLVFDENYVVQDGGAWRVPDNAGFDPGMELAVIPQQVKFPSHIKPQQKGYIYIWVSNESENTKVWFDDLKVTHTKSRVVQASDYYAWGSTMREQRTPENPTYRYGYQGQYSEKDEETGWNHFELREYDAIVGRWTSVDPEGQFPSPYVGMGNDPVNGTDPDGGWVPGAGFFRNIFKSDSRIWAENLAASWYSQVSLYTAVKEGGKWGVMSVDKAWIDTGGSGFDKYITFTPVGSDGSLGQIEGGFMWSHSNKAPGTAEPFQIEFEAALFVTTAGSGNALKAGLSWSARALSGGRTFAQYKLARGGTQTLAEIATSTGVQRISTEFHHVFLTQRLQRAYGLPNWLINNRLNVWKLNTVQHSLIDSYRYNFLRAGFKSEVGWFGNYNWFTKF